MFLGVLGLIFSWSSGWFDVQQKKLDTQRISLEFDVKQLEVKKSEQQQRLTQLEVERSELKKRVDLLQQQNDELQGLKVDFVKQANALAGEETNKQNLVKTVLSLQSQVRDLTATNEALVSRLTAPPPGKLPVPPQNLQIFLK